jgi:hypothetical protein
LPAAIYTSNDADDGIEGTNAPIASSQKSTRAR